MKTSITVITGDFSVEYEEEENVRHLYRLGPRGMLIVTSYTYNEEECISTRKVIYNKNEWCRVIVHEVQ